MSVGHCSLAAFRVSALPFGFRVLTATCLGVCSPWVYPAWDAASPGCGGLFLSHVREFFGYFFKYFLGSFLSLLLGPRNVLVRLHPRRFRLSSFLFLLSPVFCPPFRPPGRSPVLPQLICCWLLPAHFLTSVWSLVSPGLWETLPHLSHPVSEILNRLHYQYSEFSFWKAACLHTTIAFLWGFISSSHLGTKPLPRG